MALQRVSGTFFLVSGPSGAGKNSIISEVVRRGPNLRFAPSLSTRSMRQGESEGSPYHFVSVSEFKARIDSGDILEFVEVHGNLYGTSRSIIHGLLDRGFDVITDIEVIGAQKIALEMVGRTCSVFVTLDSDEELARRITGRHPEKPEDLSRRLARAGLEKQLVSGFDYMIDNVDLPASVALLESIIAAHKSRVAVAEHSSGGVRRHWLRTRRFDIAEPLLAQLPVGCPAVLRTYEGAQESPAESLRRLLITQHLLGGGSSLDLPALRLLPDAGHSRETPADGHVESCSAYRVLPAA